MPKFQRKYDDMRTWELVEIGHPEKTGQLNW
jgi:hypothetical protein